MTIQQNRTGADLTITLTGWLDTMTAPELETELKTSLDGVENLTLDLAALDYISSAGLRVLLPCFVCASVDSPRPRIPVTRSMITL